MSSKLESLERGIQEHWRQEIDPSKALKLGGFVASLAEPHYKLMTRLSHLGLRHAAYRTISLREFLDVPEVLGKWAPTSQVHIFVEPGPNLSGRKLRFKDIAATKVVDVSMDLSKLDLPDGYLVTVLEAPRLAYHGNIVVSDRDLLAKYNLAFPLVQGEFVCGDSPPISRGENPQFLFWQDPITEVFRHSHSDSKVRQELIAALKQIPRNSLPSEITGWRPAYQPGYYEVGIAIRGEINGRQLLWPYIYDFKPWR